MASKYKGAGLPPKTIALTFDDGPGERTIELSHFLKSMNVPAAFFVNGKMLGSDHANQVEHGGAILHALVDDGHVIGNHTQTHADLTALQTTQQIVAEVDETDALIAPYVPDGRFLFRPPFGAYTAATFDALQGSPMKKYVGPIDWDVGAMMGPDRAADWDCWSALGASTPAVLDVKTCGDLYLAEIRAQSSGAIVLLHDPYFIDNDPTKGGTVDMVEYIVPILKAEGFTFVRVDTVPVIATDLPPLTTTTAATPDAGASASASTSSSSGNTSPSTASGSSGNEAMGPTLAGPKPPSGDSSDPCLVSPQPQHGNYGESGNLRHP